MGHQNISISVHSKGIHVANVVIALSTSSALRDTSQKFISAVNQQHKVESKAGSSESIYRARLTEHVGRNNNIGLFAKMVNLLVTQIR